MTRFTMVRLWLAALALVEAAPSQSTWRVGSPLFPHNNFHEIQDAFDAAMPGDTIVVENKGVPYLPASTSKGLIVVSTPGWILTTPIRVFGMPADQTFVMAGFQGAFPLKFTDCEGPVYIDGSRFGVPFGCSSAKVRLTRCHFVSFNQGGIWDVVIEDSTALLTSLSIVGLAVPCPSRTTAAPALRVLNSDVTLVNVAVAGAMAFPVGYHPPVATTVVRNSRLRIAGPSVITTPELVFPFPQPLVRGPSIDSENSLIVLDPQVDVRGAVIGASDIVFESDNRPYVCILRVFPPTTTTVPIDIHGQPGATAIALVSLPSLPTLTPFGDLWLDPSPGGIIAAGSGVIPPTGELNLRTDLNAGWPVGAAPAFQAIVVDPAGIQLSMPSIGVRFYF